MSTELTLKLGKDLSEIALVVTRLEAFGNQHQVAAELIGKVNLCLEELIVNIIHYGMTGPGSSETITLHVELLPQGLRVDLADPGEPFDPFNDAPPPDLESEPEQRQVGGLGIHLVKSLADQYQYRRDATRNYITLTFND